MAQDQSETPRVFFQLESIIEIEPFIEQLAPGLSKVATNALADVITDWASEVCLHKIGLATDDLSNIADSAILLRRQLTGLQELFSKCKAQQADEQLRTSRDKVIGQLLFYISLDHHLKTTTPPLNIGSLCGVLSEIIERATKIQSPKRAPGKPMGIKNYPALHFLVANLGYWAENHLSAPFTAYVKRAGETKIAVGSLIETLNLLREHILKSPQKWLASSLPTATEHLRCVSSYQRCLREAWEERERDGAAPTAMA
jgi:hypothetical protein